VRACRALSAGCPDQPNVAIFAAMSESAGLSRFFAELKRRHVFRVSAVYGAAGFAVLQAADILFPRIGLPDWTVTLVAALALVGFPFALILAWAYERTPDGLHKTEPAQSGELEAIAAEPAGRRWPIGLAALGGIVLLGLGAWWVLGRPDAAEAQTYDSIAVLPFVNMTGDEENEYLGDGLAEELLNSLAGIDDLRVAARTSSFAFKNTNADIRLIADSLDVATVLEGSVRGSGDRRRITAQLIDARDGSHIWSETYDRAEADLLAIQDDLTARITGALAGTLTGSGAPTAGAGLRPGAHTGTDSPEAYDLYLRGRYFWNKRTPADHDVAIGLFRQAIEADSGFAAAYAAIAESRAVPSGWGADPGAALDTAAAYAERALALDPTLAQAHSALAFAVMERDLDFPRAERSFRRAIELDPNYATAHSWYAELLAAMERHEESVASAARSEELDPTGIIMHTHGRELYFAGRYEEAIAQMRRLAERGDSTFLGTGLSYVIGSLFQLGEYERMLDEMEAAAARFEDPEWQADVAEQRDSLEALGDAGFGAYLARRASRDLEAFTADESAVTNPFLARDLARVRFAAAAWAPVDADTALALLSTIAERSDEVDARVVWFEVLLDPVLDGLRDDPRYERLMAAFGL
jgi:TolB-like protein/Tfp pilus assembly protein PilF